MNSEGTIVLKLEDVSLEETRRYEQIISILISRGAFNVRSGHVTMHFDQLGDLGLMEIGYVEKQDKHTHSTEEKVILRRWRRANNMQTK